MSEFFVILLLVILVYQSWYQARHLFQRRYIERFTFPPAIKNKLKRRYPKLSDRQLDLIFRGLRDYFLLCHQSPLKMVAMPSQAVDSAWHEFILFTRYYQHFCRKALGRFLHHTPAEAMRSPTHAQVGIQRAWRLACYQERLDPKHPTRLPLLFALDKLLEIDNGFYYSLNCRKSASSRPHYCAGDIGCSSGCAGDSGGESGDASSGDTSGCGGDSGGGCGGD